MVEQAEKTCDTQRKPVILIRLCCGGLEDRESFWVCVCVCMYMCVHGGACMSSRERQELRGIESHHVTEGLVGD